MGNIDSKRKLMMFGGVLGVFGALLAWMGNPKNMAIWPCRTALPDI